MVLLRYFKRPRVMVRGRFICMVPSPDFPSNSPSNGAHPKLPFTSFPGQRPLLRGREVSVFCGPVPSVQCETHTHPQFQITFQFAPASCVVSRRLRSGKFAEQRMTGRNFYCVAPGVPHGCRWEAEAVLLKLYYEPSFLARLPEADVRGVFAHDALPSVETDRILWALAEAIRQLCLERDDPDPALVEAVSSALARRLFSRHGRLGQSGCAGTRLSPERLGRVLEYIGAHLDHKMLVSQLAGLVALSGQHFNEVFRNTMGVSPMEYVRDCRRAKAHQMAMSCDYRPTEIALECGFSDLSHFNREFRRFFGYPARRLVRRWTVSSYYASGPERA